MSNAVNQPLFQSAIPVSHLDRARLLGKILIVFEVLAAILLAYLSLRMPDWQLYPVIMAALAAAAMTALGNRFIRQERPQLGIKLIVGATLGFMLLTIILIGELGLLLGLSGIILTLNLVNPVLPRKEAFIAVSVAGGVAVGAFILDAFAPPFRSILPMDPSVLPLTTLTAVIALGVLSAIDFFDRPLWVKFVIVFLALTALPLAGVTYINELVATKTLTATARQNLQTATFQTTQILEDFFQNNLTGITEEARRPQLAAYLRLSENERSFSVEAQEAWLILQSLSRTDRVYLLSYALLDRQGRTLIDTNASGRSLNRFAPDYFETLKSGPRVSPVMSAGDEDLFTFHFTSPVRDSDGVVVGVLVMHYDATILQKMIGQQTGLGGAQSYTMLLDEYHIRLADGGNPSRRLTTLTPLSQETLITLQAERRLPPWLFENLASDLSDLGDALHNLLGSQFFTFQKHSSDQVHSTTMVAASRRFSPHEGQDMTWYVVTVQPESAFLAPVRLQKRNTLLLAAFAVGAAIAAALLLGNRLSGPLDRLTALASKAAAGDLADRMTFEADDEIGVLARTYNQLADQLSQRLAALAETITARNDELAFSVTVGQKASSTRDLDQIVSTAITMIRDQFNLYHVQLLLTDDTQHNLVLSAATGEIGQQLIERGFRLPLPHNSVIGWVAQQRDVLVLPDVSDSSFYNPIPLLARTRSELAAPLVVQGTVIGVLDMHSARENTFTEDSRAVFEAIAIQLAGAIDTARQAQLVQETRQRLDEAARLFAKESWGDRLRLRRVGEALGFAYNLSTISPLQAAANSADVDRSNAQMMSAPLLVQNEAIGQLTVSVPQDRKWSQDEQLLLDAVARQLAQKAENLRLFDDVRERATREQIVRQITDRIRASGDIEMAMKSAAQELTKALRGGRAVVDLRVDRMPGEHSDPASGSTNGRKPKA